MKPARLLNRAEDYKRLGITEEIAPWEDARRDNARPGIFEWWHFDLIADDGTKVMVMFQVKEREAVKGNVDAPYVTINIVTPDGSVYKETASYPVNHSVFATDKCNIQIGPHTVRGDMKEYELHIDNINGLSADLILTSLGKPWRPGAGYMVFGDQEDLYFTWLCGVPRGHSKGSITVKGEKKEVQGAGYHDHQWGNAFPEASWNHWIWTRQNLEDYTIVVFDLVANKKYGYKRYPLVFAQDKHGEVVFDNFDASNVKLEILGEYSEEESGKKYPSKFKYTFSKGGKTLEYTVNAKQKLEVNSVRPLGNGVKKATRGMMGLQPSYVSFEGVGDLALSEAGQTKRQSGNLIYEFMYNAKSYKEHI